MPGEGGFRPFVNAAAEAGAITRGERLERRRAHRLVVAVRRARRRALAAELVEVDRDLVEARWVEPVSVAAAERKAERVEILARERARVAGRLERLRG